MDQAVAYTQSWSNTRILIHLSHSDVDKVPDLVQEGTDKPVYISIPSQAIFIIRWLWTHCPLQGIPARGYWSLWQAWLNYTQKAVVNDCW